MILLLNYKNMGKITLAHENRKRLKKEDGSVNIGELASMLSDLSRWCNRIQERLNKIEDLYDRQRNS